MTKPRMLTLLALGAGLALLLATPATAAAPPDHGIASFPAGFDYWQTLGSGATAYSFESDPLPAGFFCRGSKAFRGTLSFEGVPLDTRPAKILGTTDTIIERLDTAFFDASGVGRTRIVARALNLKSNERIRTSCGLWTVAANLADEQPVSHMELRRTHANGGYFDTDLRLNVKLTFTRVGTGEVRELVRTVNMPTTTSTAFTCLARTTPTTTSYDYDTTAQQVDVASSSSFNIGNATPVSSITVDFRPNDCVVGRECESRDNNGNGVLDCMYVYSWHDPAPPDKEHHFTHTPCQLGYRQFCNEPTIDEGFDAQLRELRGLGYVTDSPEVILERQKNPEAPRANGKN